MRRSLTVESTIRRALHVALWLCAALAASCGGTQRADRNAEAVFCTVFRTEHRTVVSSSAAIDDSTRDAAVRERRMSTDARLPEVMDAQRAWTQLRDFSRCQRPQPAQCADALAHADRWWAGVRTDAQRLFVEDEAPNKEIIRAWTIERQRFFERWLSTPTPVLVMDAGVFRLSSDVGAVLQDWATCAEDAPAMSRWAGRTAE